MLIGLVCLVIATWMEEKTHDSSFRSFATSAFTHLAVALIAGGLLVSTEKIVFFRELRHELMALLHLSRTMVTSGIADVAALGQRRYTDFSRLIQSSKELSIVVNYGGDWVSNWWGELRERFAREGTVTEWFSLDPESEAVALLAKKQKQDITVIQQKIADALHGIKYCYENSGKKGVLRIYKIKSPLLPTVSIYLGTSGERGHPNPDLLSNNKPKGGGALNGFQLWTWRTKRFYVLPG